jgi:orotidine-5'-phosphate decarboxylase
MFHWGDFAAGQAKQSGSLVLGIDPVHEDIPHCFRDRFDDRGECLAAYIGFLIETSKHKGGFVKFQAAFFEAFGLAGLSSLSKGIALAKKRGLGVILDAKRGDIGSTAAAYARAYLTPASAGGLPDFEVDCLTVNPFLGPDTLEPFVDCSRRFGKGLFILTKTSNPGSAWLQDKHIDGEAVSDRIARMIGGFAGETLGASGLGAVGPVVGATFPEDGRRLRALMPDSIFLAPGIGPQGGTPDNIAALKREAGGGVLVPVSRGLTKVDDLTVSRDAYGAIIQARIEALAASLGQTL